ncbi:MAG: glycosyltransferase family 1 protein [Limnoraphis robusta]
MNLIHSFMDDELAPIQRIQTQLNVSLVRLKSILAEPQIDSRQFREIENKIDDKLTQSILFYRSFTGLSGGHLKVWDYFNHVFYTSNFIPYIYFYSQQTCWDESNPWLTTDPRLILSQPLENPGFIFIDGLDWLQFEQKFIESSPVPILNLIQGIRHTYPEDPRYAFLNKKAIRICVSQEIKESLLKCSQVNGPLFVIPNGLNLRSLPQPLPTSEKTEEILISAFKEPGLGLQLKQQLQAQGKKVKLLITQQTRSDYLCQLNPAKIAIFLPNYSEGEGFYLPALEGMALGSIVICPDCIGNRSFCLPSYNCFRPDYNIRSILNAVEAASQLSIPQIHRMVTNAQQTANQHSLARERQAFLEILENIEDLWHSSS